MMTTLPLRRTDKMVVPCQTGMEWESLMGAM
jgi:hypothetical protein